MCFVGVFPPEPGLKRAGGLRTLGEGPRGSGTAMCLLPMVAPICVDISGPHSLFSCVPTCICKGEKAGSCPRCLGSRGRVSTAQPFPGWTGALVNSPSPINIVPAAGGPQTGAEYQALSHPAGQKGRRFCTEARLGTRKGRPHFWSGAPRLRLLLTVGLSTRSGSRWARFLVA